MERQNHMKYYRLLWIVTIVLFVMIAFISISGGSESRAEEIVSTLDKVKSSGEMRVGFAIYAPYVQKNLSSGELSGYSIDIVEQMAEEMGIEIEYVESSWQSYISDLKTDKYDIFIGPSFSTIKRSMEVDFPTPYGYFSGVAGLVRKDDFRFNRSSDLNHEGIVIAVPQGWIAHEFATKHLKKATVKAFKQEGAALALVDVVIGNSDVSLADGPSVQQYLENNPNQDVKAIFIDNPLVIVPAGFAVKQGDAEWLEFLDQSIENLRVSGDLESLAEGYHLYSYDIKNEFVLQ